MYEVVQVSTFVFKENHGTRFFFFLGPRIASIGPVSSASSTGADFFLTETGSSSTGTDSSSSTGRKSSKLTAWVELGSILRCDTRRKVCDTLPSS